MLSRSGDPALRRARRALSDRFPNHMIRLVNLEARPWASATFEGMIYRLYFDIGEALAPALVAHVRAALEAGTWLTDNQVPVDVHTCVEPTPDGRARHLTVEVLALLDTY